MLTDLQLSEITQRYDHAFRDYTFDKEANAVVMARSDIPALLQTVSEQRQINQQLSKTLAGLMRLYDKNEVEIPAEMLKVNRTIQFVKTPKDGLKVSLAMAEDFTTDNPQQPLAITKL